MEEAPLDPKPLKIRRYSHLFARAVKIHSLNYGWTVDCILAALERNLGDEEAAIRDIIINDKRLEGMQGLDEATELKSLTFGVESEFVLRWYRYRNFAEQWEEEWEDRWKELRAADSQEETFRPGAVRASNPNYNKHRLFTHRMMDAVRRKGLPALEELRPFKFGVLEGWNFPANPLRRWIFKDETIDLSDDERDGPYSAHEATSPKLHVTDQAWKDVRRFFRTIRRPPRPREKYWPKPFVGRKCGLHVHVGHPRLEWTHVKNLLIIYSAFETEIVQVHPAHRVKDFEYAQNAGSRDLEVDADSFEIQRLSRRGWPYRQITRILETDNAEKIEDQFVHASVTKRYQALNLQNLKAAHHWTKNPKNTVEFRQHEGTMRGREIVHWAKFLTKLVAFAFNAKIGEVLRLVQRHLPLKSSDRRHGRFLTLFALMDQINLEEDSIHYFQKRVQRMEDVKRGNAFKPEIDQTSVSDSQTTSSALTSSQGEEEKDHYESSDSDGDDSNSETADDENDGADDRRP